MLTMELYVETLTGAVFELRVSPFETIMSVKAKIQRLEGIHISQQHLIWQSVELEDDYCLHDYNIHDGATLKLVLAMRGGPINTRRIPVDDPALREMAEYMEANRDEILDKLPASRQVTLLVYREGDQLNFFRVVDRGDGTLTPLSESLGATSVYNFYDEEVEEATKLTEKLEENDKMKEKMDLLRLRMENMSVTKKPKKISPHPPIGRPGSRSKIRHFSSAGKLKPHITNHSLMSKTYPLPPVNKSSRSHVLPNHIQKLQKESDLDDYKPSYKIKDHSRDLLSQFSRDSARTLSRSVSCNTELDDLAQYELSLQKKLRSTLEENELKEHLKDYQEENGKTIASSKNSSANLLVDREILQRDRSNSSHSRPATNSRYGRDVKQGILLESLTSEEARGLLRQASLERLGSSKLSGLQHPTFSLSGRGERLHRTETRLSGRLRRSATRENCLSPRLPPVKQKKKTSKRCFICCKKTGLATSYQCRCGNNFCASHRYAETHNCNFDYKSEGRKLLEQSNPVINAPKLPKI